MNDEELEAWITRVEEQPEEEYPAYGYYFGPELAEMRRVLAAIAQRHLDGIAEPVEEVPPGEVPVDYV